MRAGQHLSKPSSPPATSYTMGGKQSMPTVLDCMLKNFKKGYGGDYGVRMTPGKLRTLCELEWPTFNISWPSEGTLDLAVIQRVYTVVTSNPGHPDQLPYIDSWLEIARTLPPWVRFCSSKKGQCRILVNQALKGTPNAPPTKAIHQGDHEEELQILPPAYVPPVLPTALDAIADTPPPSVSVPAT